MSIETTCSGCGRQLRVADEHAGKQARCPMCHTVCAIPQRSPDGYRPSSGDSRPHFADDPTAPREPSWFLRTPEGQTYGPTPRPELDQWVAQGRVTADCQVRPENSSMWQAAHQLYPALRPAAAHAPGGFASPTGQPNPFSERTHNILPVRPNYQFPHRGGLILTLGILGFVISCPILSVMAWVMGSTDMGEIRAGRMDPSGVGLTQAGQILGMIYSLLWIAIFVIFLFILVVGIAAS